MAQTKDTHSQERRATDPDPCADRKSKGRWLRRIFYTLFLLPSLILGGGSVWLTFYPPNLDRFLPQINQYLSTESGFAVQLQGLTARGGLSLAVEGSNISIALSEQTQPFLQSKTVLLRFSPVNWAKGWNSVGVVIEGADINLHRDEKNRIFIGDQQLNGTFAKSSHRTRTGNALPLSSITLRNSQISWVDEKVKYNKKPAEINLSAVNASVMLELDGTLKVTVDGQIPTDGRNTTLAIKGGKNNNSSWVGELKVEGMHVDAVRPYVDHIRPLRGFSSLLNLEASLLWEGDADKFTSFWRFKAGWGVIKWPMMFRWPLPITSLLANGSLIVEKGISRFEVGQFDLDNLHGKANGHLLLAGLGGADPTIDLEVDAGGVPVNKAKFYYPYGIMHEEVVSWLDNSLKNGIVNHANVIIRGPLFTIPYGKPIKIGDKEWVDLKKNTQFSVDGEVNGLSLRFFPGLLPLDNISGNVLFDRKSFSAKIDKAQFGNSHKIKGDVKIANLVHQPVVDIEFLANQADLETLWKEVVASPTLKWDSSLGLTGSRLSGQSDVTMKIAVPLWHMKDTTFSGRMDFSEAKVKLPFFDPVFSNVKGWLKLAPEKIGISVLESKFADFPIHGQINLLDYSEPNKVSFDARFNSSISDVRLSKWFSPLLGSDGEFVGTAPFWLDVKRSANDPHFIIKAKLIADSLDIQGVMGWQKPEGEQGALSCSGNLKLDGMLFLSKVEAGLGNLDFAGDGRWDLSRNQGELHLTKFNLGETKGRLGIAQTNPLSSGLGDWLVRADLDLLDLSALWESKIRRQIEHIKPIVDREWPRVNLKLKSHTVLLADRSKATDIIAEMDIEKRFLKLHTLQGLWGEGDVLMKGELLWPFQFGAGFYTGWFNIESNDVGNLLESLDVHEDFMFGGSGNLDITLDGFIPPGGDFKDHLTGVGHIKLRNGSFAKLDFFSTILGLFSLKDLPNLIVGDRPDLEADGFGYKSFKGELLFEDSVLRTNSMVLNGPSMKIVMSGWVDLPEERLKLLIGIRPLQTLDSFISKVPLLGTILTGNRGAVLETQFDVEGELQKPKVTIRPFSSLAPGIVRDILNVPTDSAEKDTDNVEVDQNKE